MSFIRFLLFIMLCYDITISFGAAIKGNNEFALWLSILSMGALLFIFPFYKKREK